MCFTHDRVHKRHFETPLSLFRVFAMGSEPSYAVLRGAQTLRRHVSRIKMSRSKTSLENDRCYVRRTIFRPPLSHFVVVRRSSIEFCCSIRGVVADGGSRRRRTFRGTFLYLKAFNYDNVFCISRRTFEHPYRTFWSSRGRP